MTKRSSEETAISSLPHCCYKRCEARMLATTSFTGVSPRGPARVGGGPVARCCGSRVETMRRQGPCERCRSPKKRDEISEKRDGRSTAPELPDPGPVDAVLHAVVPVSARRRAQRGPLRGDL
ncbi:unnamed protein product [Prorocentrum cordatum]|uniref:Uncharacterized protein n=1 Tax=Prorocentrum cordatum TaxID=2364126 RepID=A0ABN9V1N0_9DINO|nr:unnamed protein product [Polarella glacialis]